MGIDSLVYITENEVESLLDMPTAIAAMEGAFRALAEQTAHNVPRVRARGKGIVLHSMCAAADYLGLVGWKQYATTARGATFHAGMYDQASGKFVALIEANRLGQLRTGAVTGLAAKFLAPAGAEEIGLFGTGWQAESQLAAVATALPVKRAVCYSRSEQRRREFAEKMSRELAIDVTPVDEPRAASQDRPIVITATNSREPVFDGQWLTDGTLVCAIGSNWLKKAEIDVTTVRRADLIVCDSVECCRGEAGDFVAAIQAGAFDWSQAVDLCDIVTGRVMVPASLNGCILFKSVGMAIEDVALGSELLTRARASNVGRVV